MILGLNAWLGKRVKTPPVTVFSMRGFWWLNVKVWLWLILLGVLLLTLFK